MPYPGLNHLCASMMRLTRSSVPLPPYAPPEAAFPDREPCASDAPVFITARFRSGSTLLWQCFDRLQGYKAFYEPFNERRWFDPAARGEHVDESHRGVADYAKNYEGLEGLDQFFDQRWATQRLVMGPADKNDNMRRYVQQLINSSSERCVLQFNRIDFRLPFFRATFPNASWVHLSRNARDTWRSSLRGVPNDPSWSLLSFQPYCRFYLLPWYRDLAVSFPTMLRSPTKTHPYEIHYTIHRLSTLFARVWCDVSLRYEDMERDLVPAMKALTDFLGDPAARVDELSALSAPRTEPYDHSTDAGLYDNIEQRVEARLKNWLPPHE